MKLSIGFAVSGIALYLLLNLLPSESAVSSEQILQRDGYGGEEQTYHFFVTAENGAGEELMEIPMVVAISAQSYSQEEAEDLFEQTMEQMEERIRGDNPSLMEVSHDLKLPRTMDESGIVLKWYSSETDVIDSNGVLKTEVETETAVTLRVRLSAGEYQADYELAVRVIPKNKSETERFADSLQKELTRLNETQKFSSYVQLPEEYQGKKLHYEEEKHQDYAALPFLGILMAVIWPARKQEEEKKKEKKREQELLLDYAELVSKLMVLLGAGMTMRNAWERMVLDYEKSREQGKKNQERVVYEEMRYTYYQLKNGVSESKAYQEFGRRCKLQPYLKLSSLLEQNRRTGTKDLRRILQNEMTDAFEIRKNLALRMGEEAGTKLLLPLFLMLGIVMIMIMVPAMMTMG